MHSWLCQTHIARSYVQMQIQIPEMVQSHKYEEWITNEQVTLLNTECLIMFKYITVTKTATRPKKNTEPNSAYHSIEGKEHFGVQH